jgi:hypothetical protein
VKLAFHGFRSLTREQRMEVYNNTGVLAGTVLGKSAKPGRGVGSYCELHAR